MKSYLKFNLAPFPFSGVEGKLDEVRVDFSHIVKVDSSKFLLQGVIGLLVFCPPINSKFRLRVQISGFFLILLTYDRAIFFIRTLIFALLLTLTSTFLVIKIIVVVYQSVQSKTECTIRFISIVSSRNSLVSYVVVIHSTFALANIRRCISLSNLLFPPCRRLFDCRFYSCS